MFWFLLFWSFAYSFEGCAEVAIESLLRLDLIKLSDRHAQTWNMEPVQTFIASNHRLTIQNLIWLLTNAINCIFTLKLDFSFIFKISLVFPFLQQNLIQLQLVILVSLDLFRFGLFWSFLFRQSFFAQLFRKNYSIFVDKTNFWIVVLTGLISKL